MPRQTHPLPPLNHSPWWSFLTPDQQNNLLQSYCLLSEEKHQQPGRFQDYSFIVFPAAKAYEGFLKKLFLSLNLITPQDYNGEHFRIGKSLNPTLRHEPHENHVYDQLSHLCQGKKNSPLPRSGVKIPPQRGDLFPTQGDLGRGRQRALRASEGGNPFRVSPSEFEGDTLPRQLWDTWKQSRNLLFHWFPQQQNFISLSEAEHRLHLIIKAIDTSFAQCQLGQNGH